MPQRKVKLIVNPNADLGRAWRLAADLRPVVQEFGGADWTGTVYPTHAIELARQAAEDGYELVIAAGGDGTVHEVVNGLMQVPQDRRPMLGVVPLGTGNDFSNAAGMNRDPIKAIRQVFTGKPKQVDIGLVQDEHGRREYWDNTVGVGFDTAVTIRTRRIRYLHGFLAYLYAVLQTIILNNDAPRFKIESDLEQWERELTLIVLCNGGREGGGFYISPPARLDDGVLHYASLDRVSRLFLLRILPEVMRGTHGRFRQVRMGQFHQMKINSDRSMYVHTDGEIFAGFGFDVRHLSFEILPGAMTIVA